MQINQALASIGTSLDKSLEAHNKSIKEQSLSKEKAPINIFLSSIESNYYQLLPDDIGELCEKIKKRFKVGNDFLKNLFVVKEFNYSSTRVNTLPRRNFCKLLLSIAKEYGAEYAKKLIQEATVFQQEQYPNRKSLHNNQKTNAEDYIKETINSISKMPPKAFGKALNLGSSFFASSSPSRFNVIATKFIELHHAQKQLNTKTELKTKDTPVPSENIFKASLKNLNYPNLLKLSKSLLDLLTKPNVIKALEADKLLNPLEYFKKALT